MQNTYIYYFYLKEFEGIIWNNEMQVLFLSTNATAAKMIGVRRCKVIKKGALPLKFLKISK